MPGREYHRRSGLSDGDSHVSSTYFASSAKAGSLSRYSNAGSKGSQDSTLTVQLKGALAQLTAIRHHMDRVQDS